ncbi:hypothetical protein WISP_78814 [Willisornis vidua]|uniref:IPO5 protein n=1 Tax=Willisornis vidua TaxID=1566151 RepID=A0ABQ9D587_9PASS|nr:hypothetical protein WISP_78814 [Willisornis vidua]
MPLLLECAQVRGPEYLTQMWHFMCDALIKAIGTEPESDVLSEIMHSFAKCIEVMGDGCLNNEHFEELGGILKGKLEEHFKNQELRQAKRQDEDYDEQVEESLQDEDDSDIYILTKVSDILQAIFSSYKEKCPHRPWPDRQWGLCIFDDIVEHCSPASFKYAEYFLRPMLESVCDSRPEVRQAAAYGVGVMAQFGGDSYRPFCPEALPLLVRVIQSPDAKTKDNINATENCISAVGKIMKFKPDCINVEEVLPHWLSWLPIHEDKEEAVHAFNYLCDLLESNNPVVLGPNNSNLPRILGIIADGEIHEAIKHEDPCIKRLANVVRQVQMVKFLVYEWIAELGRVKGQPVFLVVKAQKTNYRGIKGHQAQVSFEFVQKWLHTEVPENSWEQFPVVVTLQGSLKAMDKQMTLDGCSLLEQTQKSEAIPVFLNEEKVHDGDDKKREFRSIFFFWNQDVDF